MPDPTAKTETPILELTQYTDPYCTWCWGSEPIMRRIEEVYGGQISMDFVMGGLVEDASAFHDPLNKIGGPEMAQQVADHWREASERHGMPVDADVWLDMKDEFRSTWPANIAVKAAQMQDPKLAAKYLRRLREAAGGERQLIHRPDVQAKLAAEVGLNPERLLADIKNGSAEAAFMEDVKECRERQVTGYPSFLIRNAAGDEFMFFGYHSFNQFVPLFKQLAGDALATREITADDDSLVSFVNKYGKVAAREAAEVFSLEPGEAQKRLEGLAATGRLEKRQAGNGWFYLGKRT